MAKSGEVKSIAYIVPAGPWTADDLARHTRSVAPNLSPADIYLSVSTLPVTDSGEIDATPYASSPPTAHWKFDEGEGVTAIDAAGDSDGTVAGAQWVEGMGDAALDFNGSGDHGRRRTGWLRRSMDRVNAELRLPSARLPCCSDHRCVLLPVRIQRAMGY